MQCLFQAPQPPHRLYQANCTAQILPLLPVGPSRSLPTRPGGSSVSVRQASRYHHRWNDHLAIAFSTCQSRVYEKTSMDMTKSLYSKNTWATGSRIQCPDPYSHLGNRRSSGNTRGQEWVAHVTGARLGNMTYNFTQTARLVSRPHSVPETHPRVPVVSLHRF